MLCILSFWPCLALSCPSLPYSRPPLPCPILPCLALLCLPCHALFPFVLSCLALHALSCPTLPCIAQPSVALSCIALPCLALSLCCPVQCYYYYLLVWPVPTPINKDGPLFVLILFIYLSPLWRLYLHYTSCAAAVLVLAMCTAAVDALGCPVPRLPQTYMIAAYQHIMRGSQPAASHDDCRLLALMSVDGVAQGILVLESWYL
jgi:hypothetical protein